MNIHIMKRALCLLEQGRIGSGGTQFEEAPPLGIINIVPSQGISVSQPGARIPTEGVRGI